ncbi:MAG: sigma-54-dependent Fis family transcriptional regulator, partial [bacterium]|nr:sigma-54-dependent Fis family transcriptional regulator [bacterium]
GGDLRLHSDQSRPSVAIDGSTVDGSRTIPVERLDEGVVLEMAQRIVLLLHRHPPAPCEVTDCFGLVGKSAELEQVRTAIAHVADLDVPVLIRGETGTGKELVARALHEHSPRHGKPFVSVNVGALPPSLAVAELFGCKKGAYTGAVRDRPGYFGRADGGTLFLDEIGEAPAELQVMLLRALEAGEILPVGTQTPRPVDVRIISATDIDLQLRVSEGAFRAPLLHRLASYTIHLPPLRRRRDDLGRLLLHFLRDERTRVGESSPPNDPSACTPWLPAALVGHLARYHWPGNVRQLRNVTRQLVIDSRGQPVLGIGLRLEDLLPAAAAPEPAAPSATALALGNQEAGRQTTPRPAGPPPAASRRRKPSEVSEQELLDALRTRRWNLKATAEELGIPRTSLYALLERSPRVRAAADVSPEEIRCAWERHGGRLEDMVEELEISERALRQRLKDLGLR